MTTRLLRPFRRAETYRALLFYVAELALGAAGFVVLVAGWSLTLTLAITPLVVPLLIGLRAAVGALAQAEAAVARKLLGARSRPRASSPGRGFWNRGFAVVRDGAFWRQQAQLLLAWPIALVPLAVLSWAAELITVPIWHRWVDSRDVVGLFEVDSFPESLPFAAAGLALLIALAHLLGPMSSLSRRLAAGLLDDDGAGVGRSREELRVMRLRSLTITSLVSTAIAGVLVVIWAATPTDYFWPIWPLLSLGLLVGILGWVMLVLEHPSAARLAGGSEALAIQVGASAVLVGFLVAVWAVTTSGYFWPIWPALGLTLLAIVHAAVVYARRHRRIEVLEASRAGAVDAQESELRRIERDLHDGAQARLVALGMSLGLAEQHLGKDPDAVRELIAEARLGAAEALEELRDLARGIHPPILADRGLEAAVAALASRSPVPVSLSVDVSERPAAPVETAAYFTVSEGLANAIKHSGATQVTVRIAQSDGVLFAEVGDDGRGGADSAGNGLKGLRQRIEALDGTLWISSPEGGPTTIRAVVPCAS
ncbi:MAG TPA: sensor histidine kinase [Gaiellaceae bacterium]